MNEKVNEENVKKYNKQISKITKPIILLDMGINGLSALNELASSIDNEDIIYMNDMLIDNYELLEEIDIQKRIDILLDRVKELDPKLIVIANDSLIEYGKEKLDALNVTYVNIVEEIIEYVNRGFEGKNMAFFATQGMIEANLYQKYITYSRLYNLNADNIMDSLSKARMKTSESFKDMKNALMPLYKKDVDLVIPTLPNIMLFKTEIMEYIDNPNVSIVDARVLLSLKAKDELKHYMKMNKIEPLKKNNKSKVYVIASFDKKDEKKALYDKILNIKYNLLIDKREDKGKNIIYNYRQANLDN